MTWLSKHKLFLVVILLLVILLGVWLWSQKAIDTAPGLTTKYINAVDWPPQVQVVAGPFSCTEPKVIAGRTYCVTKVSEGAAGSTYTQYAYALALGGQVKTFTFTLRFSQCANYDEPQKSECEAERASFDPDQWIDKIVENL